MIAENDPWIYPFQDYIKRVILPRQKQKRIYNFLQMVAGNIFSINQMNYILTPYAIAQFITAIVSSVVVIALWKRRFERGGFALFFLFVALTEWAFCIGMESAAVTLPLKIAWSQWAYIGTQSSSVLIYIFALKYSKKTREISKTKIALLFMVPVIIILLAATNQYHHLVWSSYSWGEVGSNSIIYNHGPAFWVGIIYIYILVALSTGLLILSSVKSQKVYRMQNLIFILASITPWLTSVLYITRLNPFPGLDITSLGFFFTGILMLIGIRQANLLNYIPIAHELLFENISEGVIVFNENKKVIDMNPGAEKLMGMNFSELIANDSPAAIKCWNLYDDHFSRTENSRFEIVSPFNNHTWLNINISPLKNKKGSFLGWVAIMEDITLRRETEKELQRINQRLASQLDENRQLEKQLREQANRDAMTGVYNRACLKESLASEILYAEQQNQPLSIVMIDVDHFKNINDTYGHKAGDDVLIALGKLLLSQTRDGDFVSRFGGDEFVLFLPGMNCDAAFQRAESWRKTCKKLKIPDLSESINVNISIGIAVYPDNARTMDALLSEADRALYQAKQSGRDCTKVSEFTC
jgi:diguanylate cyclase (GGDEF)-like protein/PAS domain S-box-containing protein